MLLHLSCFSPAASWEVLIKVDASTDFGAGGVCIPSFANLIHEWSPTERYDALHHCDEPIRESTCFFELQAIYLMLLNSTPLLVGKRVPIECDNKASISQTDVHESDKSHSRSLCIEQDLPAV
jgi:hypothetical protein